MPEALIKFHSNEIKIFSNFLRLQSEGEILYYTILYFSFSAIMITKI